MPTLPKVLINQADSKSAGGVALRVRTQGLEFLLYPVGFKHSVIAGVGERLSIALCEVLQVFRVQPHGLKGRKSWIESPRVPHSRNQAIRSVDNPGSCGHPRVRMRQRRYCSL